MTDDNSNLVDMDNLDVFEAAFYGRETPEPSEQPVDEEVDETGDDTAANEEHEFEAEEEVVDPETSEEEPEEEEKPKGKKRSFQDRIDELVADKRQTQRQLDAVMRELEDLRSARKTEEKKEEPTLREQLSPNAPNPDALDDKGEPIYPLGEFDKAYIRDLTKFMVEQETTQLRQEQEKAAKEREAKLAEQQLTQQWAEKIEAVKEELPDFGEKVLDLETAFRGIEPQYGNFLATTIMSCDNGPEIMYYLSQNIGEAQKIVASGPYAATFAIAKLQAKFEKPASSKDSSNKKKVSDAPKPPVEMVRGKGGQFATRPDTDDLDAFEREFFNRK